MSVKIMSAMPRAEHNGLSGQEDRIESQEGELIALVVMVEVAELGRIVASDEPTVKLRMAEVELVEKDGAMKLLRAGRKERTGHEELDFDALEDGGDDE